ncbi:MAG TPA: energy transducer TonB, partial [Verrucomicrobiae bacterium]
PVLVISDPVVSAPVALLPAATATTATVDAPMASGPTATGVQTLTYGVGDGRQPAPRYPRESMRARQEGCVGVRFWVGENGAVEATEMSRPSPYPLLNDEAVRTIRKRWHFPGGNRRAYDVTIRFELNSSRGES